MARDMKDASGGRETGHNSRQRIRTPSVPGAPVVRSTRESRLRTSTCSLLDLDKHEVETCKTISEVTLKNKTSTRPHSRESAGSLKNKAVVPMLKAAYSPLAMFSPEPSVLSIACRDDGDCLYLRQAVSSTTCSKNKDTSVVIKPDSNVFTKHEDISAPINPDSIVSTNDQKEILETFRRLKQNTSPSRQHSRISKVLLTQRTSPVIQQVDTLQSPAKSSSETKAIKPDWGSSPETTKAADKHTEDQPIEPFENLPRQRKATSPQSTRSAWRSSPIRRPVRIKNADKHTEYQTNKPFVDLPSQRKATSPQTSRPIRRPVRERNAQKHTEHHTTKPSVDLPSQRKANSSQTSRPAWRSSPIRRPVRERNTEKHTEHHTTKPAVDLPSQRKANSSQTSRPAWRSPIRRPVTTKTLDKHTENHTTKPFVALPSQKNSILQEKPKPVRMPKIAPIVRTTRAARLRITMKKQPDSEQPDEACIEKGEVINMTPKPTESQTAGMKKTTPLMSGIEHSSTKCNSDVDHKQPIVRNTKASKLRMLKERSQESSRREFAFGTTALPKCSNERQQVLPLCKMKESSNKLPEEMKIILPKLRETVDQAPRATYPYKSTKREFAFGSTTDSRNLKAEVSRQALVKQTSQKGKLPEVRTNRASILRIKREHEAANSVKANKPDFAFGTRALQSHETEISQTKALPQQNVMDFQQYSPQPTSISSRSSDEYDYFDDLDKEEIEQTFKQIDEELDSDFEKALDSRERKINQMQQDKDFYECLVNSAIKMKQEKIRQAWLDAMNQKFSCIILGVDVNE